MIVLNTDPMAALRTRAEHNFQTEEYVCSPPALWIVDEANRCWTLGFNPGNGPRGEFSYNVLCDGQNTGVWASRIERRKGRVRCFTKDGWKVWNGQCFF